MSGKFLVESEDSLPQNATPSNPDVSSIYQGIEVNTKYQNNRLLLTHISGYKWLVDYYSQYLGADNEIGAQELDKPAAYQQYLCVHNFEMRVQDPLSPAQDSTSKEFQYEGTAIVYGTVVPNKGDVFVTDIADGRLGVFSVEDTIEASIFKDSAFQIDYKFINYLTADYALDLKNKTVKETWFHRDFMGTGQNPLLISKEHELVNKLADYLKTLPADWYREFFNNEYKTFLIPDQDALCYDPFLPVFVRGITSLEDSPLWIKVSLPNTQDGINDQIPTFWDALRERSIRRLDRASPKMALYAPDTSYQVVAYNPWRILGMDYLFYHRGVSSPNILPTAIIKTLKPSPEPTFNRPMDLEVLINTTQLSGLPMAPEATYPLYRPVTCDDYYVFSEFFYQENYENMSALEILVYFYLNNKPIPLDPLFRLLEQSYYWRGLERFYYIPILMVLVRDVFKDVN